MQTVAEIFAQDGTLHQHLAGFRFRKSQQMMAESIWQSFADRRHLAIEAGTGIGKTFAYLVPVLLSGRRVIISTGTKTLQDQLFEKDLPALSAAIGRPANVAVLKGRANYLCWHRLDLTRTDQLHTPEQQDVLAALHAWGESSETGDLSDLDDLQDDFALRADVTSTVENCLGTQCPSYGRCFVAEARKRAQAAQVVIVNHHLLLADLALKEAGFGELLGEAESVIVDEAHLLPDIAQQFFGLSFGTREALAASRDLIAESAGSKLSPPLLEALRAVESAGSAVVARSSRLAGRIAWRQLDRATLDALANYGREIEAIAELLHELHDTSPGITRCRERFADMARRLRRILDDEDSEGLRWLERAQRSLRAYWTPLELGPALASRIDEQGGTWVLTSATLAVGEDFTHFLSRLGIRDVSTTVLPSPFDYRNNARIYVPQGLPEPRDADYVGSLMSHVWPLIDAAQGGAFLLFTSHRALSEAEEWIRHRTPPGPVLVQGSGSRSSLLSAFRASRDAVLLGTNSFWQGVDVRGDALRIVVIEKLPFAAPSDPLVEARSQAIRRAGGDPFSEFQLPHAVLALKQGVGRLIRDHRDRGLIVLGDPRLRTRPYGRKFIESLPPATWLEDFDAALSFARGLRGAPDAELMSADGTVGH